MSVKVLITACLVILLSGMRICAYPTSINIIPTADIMDVGTASVSIESDGKASLVSHNGELQLYTQFGITPRFEAGIDLPDSLDRSRIWLNAKWQICSETKTRPSLAIGVLDPTREGIFSEWYLVASKDVGKLRLTSGYLDSRYQSQQEMIGVSHEIKNIGTLSMDWTTGTYGYHTFGIYRDLTDSMGMFAYYARANASSEDDYLGLAVCWSITLWQTETKGE